LFCISVSFFFLRFSISWVTSSLILSIFDLNSFISLFMMVLDFFFWHFFRASMISFICFCVFSYSLFLSSWTVLSVSYFGVDHVISMKFSLTSCRISSFRLFMWASLGSLV
jgi:hypothetical protein